MGLARIFGICAALLFASSVTAATTIDLGPSDYRNWGTGANSHTGAGIRSSTGQTVRLPPLNGNLNVTRNAVIPYGSIANGLRNFTRINPASVAASAAVTGLFLAVDWAFDHELGEWTSLQEGQLDDASFGLWTSAGTCTISGPTPEATCRAFMAGCSNYPSAGAATFSRVNVINATTAQCHGRAPGLSSELSIATLKRTGTCPEGSTFNPSTGICTTDSAFLPLTSSDWAELEASLPVASANEVAHAGRDTQRLIGNPLPGFQDQTITGPSSFSGPETTSTSTDPVTGDTIVTNTSTTTNISYGDTTITTTNTTTSTTYQNGQETSTTVTTETPGELPVSSGGGAAGDWPGFCEWATVVCDWFNWTQEEPPPDVDLPTPVDEDFFEHKNISFGAKSCPPDLEISLAPFMDTTVGVSFQPFCDFAALIYYMVMAASYIIAAYISIGVARSA